MFKSGLFNLGVKRISQIKKNYYIGLRLVYGSKWIGLFFNFLFILKITYNKLKELNYIKLKFLILEKL